MALVEFLVKTGVVAGCSLINGAINVGAGKVIDSKMVPKIPERTADMTDEQYTAACAKADKKNKIKKNIAKGTIGAVSLLGTSAGCSVALGAIDGGSAEAGSTETGETATE